MRSPGACRRIPAGLIAYGRYMASGPPGTEAIYVGEGMNSTIAVTLLDGDIVSFHVCGKVEASTEPADMRLQRMLGHISALRTPSPGRSSSSAAARASRPGRSCSIRTSSGSSCARSSH